MDQYNRTGALVCKQQQQKKKEKHSYFEDVKLELTELTNTEDQ